LFSPFYYAFSIKSLTIMNQEIKKSVNWEKLFDISLKKLRPEYIKLKCDRKRGPVPSDNMQINIVECLDDIKSKFLREITTIDIYEKFVSLQKRLPLLAEYLILDCYDKKVLSKLKFSKIFANIYVYAEKGKSMTLFTNAMNDKILDIFKYSHKSGIMNLKDRKFLRSLPHKVIIYRGVAGKPINEAKNSISWTLEKEQAKVFGDRNMELYKCTSFLLLQVEILREEILCYFHDTHRYESEVIVEPKNLSNIKYEEFNKSGLKL
jgi:hypothetical protein